MHLPVAELHAFSFFHRVFFLSSFLGLTHHASDVRVQGKPIALPLDQKEMMDAFVKDGVSCK